MTHLRGTISGCGFAVVTSSTEEFLDVRKMMTEEYETRSWREDPNFYLMGNIRWRDVVIAAIPMELFDNTWRKASEDAVIGDLLKTFDGVNHVLLVGISVDRKIVGNRRAESFPRGGRTDSVDFKKVVSNFFGPHHFAPGGSK